MVACSFSSHAHRLVAILDTLHLSRVQFRDAPVVSMYVRRQGERGGGGCVHVPAFERLVYERKKIQKKMQNLPHQATQHHVGGFPPTPPDNLEAARCRSSGSTRRSRSMSSGSSSDRNSRSDVTLPPSP